MQKTIIQACALGNLPHKHQRRIVQHSKECSIFRMRYQKGEKSKITFVKRKINLSSLNPNCSETVFYRQINTILWNLRQKSFVLDYKSYFTQFKSQNLGNGFIYSTNKPIQLSIQNISLKRILKAI